jgi:hypothetical protein
LCLKSHLLLIYRPMEHRILSMLLTRVISLKRDRKVQLDLQETFQISRHRIVNKKILISRLNKEITARVNYQSLKGSMNSNSNFILFITLTKLKLPSFDLLLLKNSIIRKLKYLEIVPIQQLTLHLLLDCIRLHLPKFLKK